MHKINFFFILLSFCINALLINCNLSYIELIKNKYSDKENLTLKHEIRFHDNNHEPKLDIKFTNIGNNLICIFNKNNNTLNFNNNLDNKQNLYHIKGCYKQKPAHLRKPNKL